MLNGRNHKIINEENAFRFSQGDEIALSFFYHELYPTLVHYSFQITKNRLGAEEIASEAFVKAWRMQYKLNSYAGIKSYLYKIVHRDSIEAFSREQKRLKIYRYLSQIHSETPFDKMVRSEVYRLIHEALKGLSPASRKVMIMHYLDGKTTGQISKELRLHPSTIKTQKMQGLKALRKIFIKPALGLFCFCIKIFLGF